MSILKAEGLKKSYDNGKTFAVNGVGFSVEKGDIVGLLGPNGAGKSTTINMITGMLSPDGGSISYEENVPFKKWKRNIGLVPQELAIYPEFSAYENVEFFCSLYGYSGSRLKELTEKALEETGLQDTGRKRSGEFSGGMKRRLNIACAIAHQPKLIVMDEPTVGIDPQSRDHILSEIENLNKHGASVIYTTHYMEEVEAICNKIIVIDSANVIANGTIDELRHNITEKRTVTVKYRGKDENAKKAAEKLRAMSEVENANADSGRIVLTLNKKAEDIFGIIGQIAAQNVVITDINSSEMSLQDIFLSLTGKELRDK